MLLRVCVQTSFCIDRVLSVFIELSLFDTPGDVIGGQVFQNRTCQEFHSEIIKKISKNTILALFTDLGRRMEQARLQTLTHHCRKI